MPQLQNITHHAYWPDQSYTDFHIGPGENGDLDIGKKWLLVFLRDREGKL